MAIAELRANAVYFLARTVGERFIKPVQFENIPGATLETADNWDRQSGNFQRSASDFHSVYLSAWETDSRVQAALGVAKEIINLGDFPQARYFLRRSLDIGASLISIRRKDFVRAEVQNRLGWIADYESGYFESTAKFAEVHAAMASIPQDKRTQEEEHLFSTAIHFYARGHFGLASQGIDPRHHAEIALDDFKKGLKIDEERREAGTPNPAVEGFQHAWISRCYMLLNQPANAWNHLEKSGELFRESLDQTPQRGIMAHYYILRGFFDLTQQVRDVSYSDIAADFHEAIRIRTEVEPYPKGLSDAYLGMAEVCKRQWRFKEAAQYGMMAFRVYPLSLLKTVAGG